MVTRENKPQYYLFTLNRPMRYTCMYYYLMEDNIKEKLHLQYVHTWQYIEIIILK